MLPFLLHQKVKFNECVVTGHCSEIRTPHSIAINSNAIKRKKTFLSINVIGKARSLEWKFLVCWANFCVQRVSETLLHEPHSCGIWYQVSNDTWFLVQEGKLVPYCWTALQGVALVLRRQQWTMEMYLTDVDCNLCEKVWIVDVNREEAAFHICRSYGLGVEKTIPITEVCNKATTFEFPHRQNMALTCSMWRVLRGIMHSIDTALLLRSINFILLCSQC